MKLACVRCKHKKIKCDKAEGRCHQCITASEECVYVERRKRRRLVQPEVEVGDLNRRLEYIEKHLGGPETESPSIPRSIEEPTQHDSIPADVLAASSTPDSLPAVENGPDSWVYRLASDATRNFEKVKTPAGTPAYTAVDNVMSKLNQALEALGRLRIRSDDDALYKHALHLSPDDARTYVKAFVDMIELLLVPNCYQYCPGFEVLQLMPDIVDSPYVNIDPCIRVLYYQALYYGLLKLHGPGNDLAQAAYYKALEAVPVWLATATGTELDVCTATLITWTTINNFDYQLSWKFHLKACQFLHKKNAHKLDVHPSATHAEEEAREGLRYIYWFVMQTDLMFRLFFSKPAALHWTSSSELKLPALNIGSVNVHAPQVIMFVVAMRYTIMTAEIFNFLESDAKEGRDENREEEVTRKVHEYCEGLEELITEWDLEERAKNSEHPVYADHLMNLYASIIGIKRLTQSSTSAQTIDAMTLRAARKVIETLLRFTSVALMPAEKGVVFVHFISFYPFIAVFSLYTHIVLSTSHSACGADLVSLENLESLLSSACTVHTDLVPFSNIIKALNKVSRAMQDCRRYGPPGENEESTAQGERARGSETVAHVDVSTPSAGSGEEPNQPAHPEQQQQQQQQQQQLLTPSPQNSIPHSQLAMDPDTFQSLLTPSMDVSGSGQGGPLSFPLDFGTNSQDFEPLGFMRALESDLIGRNWHETWWDMNGDLGGRPFNS
ncbi:hypothetical protein K505DRAFT_376215 [Melanomma pulvis-pyrius CBS 109.77]|uniref:Zn(2)-C6 fungal-type domain-containing protein n=1 Tax=Melanomma pulvis-pyrius CBS 109.77 TaxID=1314802 RepID=A0A6A6X7G2_9PLEO|nr:hypothetical protein K505DRAFT_376215 [Melanomma pulvis-pyrius CBS 109.77]